MTPVAHEILAVMKSRRNQKNIDGMARFGIISPTALGLTTPFIKDIAKRHRGNHALALELWNTGIFEARILAAFIGDPMQMTKHEMTAWAKEFDNWAICDGVCIHFFRKSPHAHALARTWYKRKGEFIKRAGFTMMATLAVHDTLCRDSVFLEYLKYIQQEATDERNGVKKAVNWALRQIGKRNLTLNSAAIQMAERIRALPASAARWIAADALRELRSESVQRRLKRPRRSKTH